MKTSTIKIGNATAAQTNKPKFCIVFVPGNCSSSKLIQHLAENDPHVPTLIIEAEIDTLSRANRSEFGGFSDLLRKAFHNEPVSYTRKLNNEFIEVEQPKLSVVLSGTPDQIQRLIGTPSDGLYSRFIFYSFNGKSEWEDVSNKKDLNFSDLLVQQSEQYFKLWEFYSDRDVHFDLTAKQWELLNNMFRSELEAVAKGTNIYAQGIVKRHGLIFFKMCVTLTAMRYFEMNDSSDQIYCSDEDFHFAKDLVLVALDSSLDLLDTFPQTSNHVNFGKRKKTIEFSKALPESFVRADAIQIGQGLDIPSARVDRWLRTLIDKGILESVKFGYYQKVGDDKNPT